MKKVFNLILLATLSVFVFSCNKNNDDEITPIRDYAEQYATDIETIKDFLKTHSISVINNPGFNDDQDISFTVVSELSAASIWGSDDATHKPDLLEWPVEKDGFTYIIYYLQLRQGSGSNSKSPCNYDNALTAYKGFLIDADMTNFQTNANPQDYINLGTSIRGWSEILPKFKTGSYVPNANGTLAYTNFGAGVIFVPSGLAYFNGSPSNIPAYSPLIFGFKLLEIQRIDHDGDGIYSYLEDIGSATSANTPDGYLRDNDTTHEDDTDQDGKPDFVDTDDDGDGFLTRYETQYLIGETKYYYPYHGDSVDNPLTPQDETKGIPRKFTGANNAQGLPTSNDPADFTDAARLRRHLDPTAKPLFSDQSGL